MAKRKKSTKFEVKNGQLVPEGSQEVMIPDEALDYIVTHFLRESNKEGMPVVIGVSSHTVESVLQLLVDWAAASGYVRDGIMTLGGHKID